MLGGSVPRGARTLALAAGVAAGMALVVRGRRRKWERSVAGVVPEVAPGLGNPLRSSRRHGSRGFCCRVAVRPSEGGQR